MLRLWAGLFCFHTICEIIFSYLCTFLSRIINLYTYEENFYRNCFIGNDLYLL